jgi:hypothetical protein
VRYLNYAIGRGIGGEDEGPGADPHAAVGLEHIGKDLSPQVDDGPSVAHSLHASSHAADSRSASVHMSMHIDELELETKLGEMHLHEQQQDDGASSAGRPAYFYGAVGNRIGEAAACFLARWGVDLFAAEEDGQPGAPAFAAASPSRGMTTIDDGWWRYYRYHLQRRVCSCSPGVGRGCGPLADLDAWVVREMGARAHQLGCVFRAGRVEAVRVCQARRRATKESHRRGTRGREGVEEAVRGRYLLF